MSEYQAEKVETPEPLTEMDQVAAVAELLEVELGEEQPEEQLKGEADVEEQLADPAETEEASADDDGGDTEPDESPVEDENPDIDYDQLIPMPGGDDPMSLGQLKDLAVKAKHVDAEMLERENQIMRDHDHLRDLIASVGEVPDNVKQAQAQQMQRHLEREHQSMLDAIPDWKDPATFKADRTEIVELGQQYGFTPDDISQISDHRAVKILRDYSRLLKSRNANVQQLEKAKKAKPVAKRKANPKADFQRRQEQARNGSLGDKVSAINELLAS